MSGGGDTSGRGSRRCQDCHHYLTPQAGRTIRHLEAFGRPVDYFVTRLLLQRASDSSGRLEFEVKGKPGRLTKLPRQYAPYHLRLDWLMWFAAFGPPGKYRWFSRLLCKLLENNAGITGLLAKNPFPNTPSAFVRARLYRYHFGSVEQLRRTGKWWGRELVGEYVPPIGLESCDSVSLRGETWNMMP